jgi:ATP-dependent DNA helicase RecG
MKKEELNLILKEGEGYKIEFKENINGLEKEIVAFANASGGRILVGVTDYGLPKGISISNKLKSQIQDIANNCKPKPFILLEVIGNILVINVREGTDKPYECSSGFFKRMGPNSQKMTRNEIIEIFKSEGRIHFEELAVPKFKYPKDFSREKLNNFLEFAGLSKSTKTETALLSLDVAEKQEEGLYFNNAGVLFFAREPQKFISWSVFTVVLFKNYEGTDVIDRKEITGSLFEIVNKVMDFVRLYAKVAYRFTGMPQRENIYEYPFDAIREAVINSVMHKDYFEHGHNNILKFFPDRIQIENIWVKPRDFILGKTIFRRNQVIADLFSRIHFGEKIGSGMQRIKEYCKVEKAPFPRIQFTETHFYVEFKPSREYIKLSAKEQITGAKITQKSPRKVPEKYQKIIDVIEKEPYISRRALSLKVNESEVIIQSRLRKLIKEGLIKRIGPDKGGYWQIVKEPK